MVVVAAPLCLANEGGIWQLTWRLAWVAVCEQHRCYLISSCPWCGQPLQPDPWDPRQRLACTTPRRSGRRPVPRHVRHPHRRHPDVACPRRPLAGCAAPDHPGTEPVARRIGHTSPECELSVSRSWAPARTTSSPPYIHQYGDTGFFGSTPPAAPTCRPSPVWTARRDPRRGRLDPSRGRWRYRSAFLGAVANPATCHVTRRELPLWLCGR